MAGNCDKITSDIRGGSDADGSRTFINAKSNDVNGSGGNSEQYWKTKYEQLQKDFDHIQRVNQNLEDKLLNVVETFEKKREELMANVEHEKSTLMADVNKLSTKLVDARIKLHDFEEKEVLHAAECNAPCHKSSFSSSSTPQVVPSTTSTPVYSNGQPSMTPQMKNSANNYTNNKIDAHQAEQMANDPNLI